MISELQSHEEGGEISPSPIEQCNTWRGGGVPGGSLECRCLSQGGSGLWEAGFLLWEVIMMRLGGGSNQTSRRCLMGEKKNWNGTCPLEVPLYSEMNLLGPIEKVQFDQDQVDTWFFCLRVNTLEMFQIRHEWICVGTQSSQSRGTQSQKTNQTDHMVHSFV